MVSRVIPVEPFDLVIFGGTGDLARRKILPALFRRYCSGQMPQTARVIGAARSDLNHDGYRDMAREAIEEFIPSAAWDKAQLDQFLACLSYVQIDATGEAGWQDDHLRYSLRQRHGVSRVSNSFIRQPDRVQPTHHYY